MRREADLVLAGFPARLERLEGDVRSLDERVGRFESGLADNTEITKRVDLKTAKIVAFVDDVDAVWRVCKIVRRASIRIAKWVAAVAGAFTAVFAALHAAGQIDVKTWFR